MKRKSSGCQLSDYIGKGKDLHPSEVPTLRAVIRKVLLVQELNLLEGGRRGGVGGLTLDEAFGQTVDSVMCQWKLASHLFEPPVTASKKNIVNLKTAWDNF